MMEPMIRASIVLLLLALAFAAGAQDKPEETLNAVVGISAKIQANARGRGDPGRVNVKTLAEFYRRIWERGPAGAEVPLKVLQGAQVREVTVRSIDRVEYFR